MKQKTQDIIDRILLGIVWAGLAAAWYIFNFQLWPLIKKVNQ